MNVLSKKQARISQIYTPFFIIRVIREIRA